jgi:hypothetical protein
VRQVKKRWLFVVTIVFAASLLASIVSLFWPLLPPGKLFATASAFAGLMALVQLDVAGVFEKLMDIYGDDEKFPNGPPSHITREVIWNPDTPVRSWLHAQLYFDPATGFWLAIVSLSLAVLGTWL